MGAIKSIVLIYAFKETNVLFSVLGYILCVCINATYFVYLTKCLLHINKINKPQSQKITISANVGCHPPPHPRSLIRVFAVCVGHRRISKTNSDGSFSYVPGDRTESRISPGSGFLAMQIMMVFLE